MTNPMSILEQSAMPNSVKAATFSSKIMWRLKTTCTALSQEKSKEVILELMS